jgi:hypothetical protein
VRYSAFAGFFPVGIRKIEVAAFGMDMVVPVLRIRNVYPGSRILTFVHPGFRIQQQQQKRGKKFAVLPFFVASNFIKLKKFYF